MVTLPYKISDRLPERSAIKKDKKTKNSNLPIHEHVGQVLTIVGKLVLKHPIV